MIKFGKRKVPMDIEQLLPSFAQSCKSDNTDIIYIKRDFFEENENELMANAINFACNHGKTVTIVPSSKMLTIFN